MIGSFRNFAKTKFAGILVFIMIIPFVFWGMGSMFSSGNTNNIVKINKTNISTQDFIDHINRSNIPQQTIRNNLDKNIIEELLSTLVSTTLLELEVKDFKILVSEETLLNKIKTNKNFQNDNGDFERLKYEKFLLENNQSAPAFELRLRGRELQKSLFDYIGAGTISPSFLTKKLYEEENKKLEIQYINLKDSYKKKEEVKISEINNFLDENKEQLKTEYIDFSYTVINPKLLIGVDEFNQTFFDKIDEIEVDISNNIGLKEIANKLNIQPINIVDFKLSTKSNDIEKKIFEARNVKFDIIENNDDYILYQINKSEEKSPDLKDAEFKEDIINLILQKNKFDFNKKLLEKIQNEKFNDNDFLKLGKEKVQTTTLNSIKDNKKFEINAVELLYSLPLNSFTLINDENNQIYLAKIKKTINQSIDLNDDNFKNYTDKQNTNNKQNILKSYDLLLNKKYNVVINEKTIERVKNFFK
jgi:peptidyl-prolyl cis-trans isomerase D